ncbi:MAG: phage tail tape measure protein [Burkholderiales bacterium]|jgi:hypothetical protein
MTNKTTIVVTAEDRASAVFRGVRGSVESAAASFASFGAAFAGLGGGAALAGLRSLVSSIDDLDEAAQGLGLTAVQLSNLQQAARESGVSAEQFGTAITRLNVRLGEAASGNEEAAQLFKAFGVAVKTAGGSIRPVDDVLRDLAGRFSQLEDGPAKAALAVDLFGRSGAKLIPLLNQGADGLERFSGLTKDTVTEAAKLQKEFDELGATFERFKNTLAGGVLPVLNDTIDVIRRLDFGRAFSQILPGRILQDLNNQVQEAAARQRQLREALALGAGQYSNEGRAALQSADGVLVNARAKRENTRATRENKDANKELFDQYEKDIAVLRERFRLEQDIARIVSERERRLADLTGRSAAEQQARDLQLIDDALFEGTISLEEFEAAYSRIFGLNSEGARGLKEVTNGVEELALTFASSLGDAISSGRLDIASFFDALLKDLLKLTTQLLIVKPLAEALRSALGDGGSLSGILGSIGGAFGFGGARAMGGPVAAGMGYLVGERGPELFVPRSSGQIVPNGGGAMNINVNLPPGTNVTRQTANQIGLAVGRQLSMAGRRNG